MRVRTDILSTDLLRGRAEGERNADYITRPRPAGRLVSARHVERTLQPYGENRSRRQLDVLAELGRERPAPAKDGADDGALGAADHRADHAPEHGADPRALGVVTAEVDVLLDRDDAAAHVAARPVVGVDGVERQVQPSALDQPLGLLHARHDAAHAGAGGEHDASVELDGYRHRRVEPVLDPRGPGRERLLQPDLDLRALGQRAAPREAPVERAVDVVLQRRDRPPEIADLGARGPQTRGLFPLGAADLHLQVRHLVADVVGPVLELLEI